MNTGIMTILFIIIAGIGREKKMKSVIGYKFKMLKLGDLSSEKVI